VVGKKASNLSLGLNIAREVLDNGKAYRKLCEYVEYSRK